MSVKSVFSCGICTINYTEIGQHRPISFDCGHGSCQECITAMQNIAANSAKTARCHTCAIEINHPTPNWDLADQMHIAAQKMVEQAANYQNLKNKLLSKAACKLLQTPEKHDKLEKSGKKFVDLGLFETSTEAIEAIKTEMQILSIKEPMPKAQPLTNNPISQILGEIADELAKINSLAPEEEFDRQDFQDVYNPMSASDKIAYRTMLWVAGDFPSGTRFTDWATSLVSKTEFSKNEQNLLRMAVEMSHCAPQLRDLSITLNLYASKILDNLEYADAHLGEWKKNIIAGWEKVPLHVRARVDQLYTLLFQPDHMLLSQNEQATAEIRKESARSRSLTRAMRLGAENNYVPLVDADAYHKLNRMLAVLAVKNSITESDFLQEYQSLGIPAQSALSMAIAYKIGVYKPSIGQEYIMGRLRVDNQPVKPDLLLLIRTLVGLVRLSGNPQSSPKANSQYINNSDNKIVPW